MDLQDPEKEKTRTPKGENDVKEKADVCVRLLDAQQFPESAKAERSWVGSILETSGKV